MLGLKIGFDWLSYHDGRAGDPVCNNDDDGDGAVAGGSTSLPRPLAPGI